MISDEQRPVDLPGFSPGAIPPQSLVEVGLASINDLRQLCFQYMRDGFSIVDTNGLHVDVNPAFCEMTGFSAQELIGSSPEHCYWPPEERVHIDAAFAKTLRGELADIELVFMRKNGERFPVIVKPFAIGDHSGIPRYYAATVRDMTQRVHLQSALQDSEARYHRLFESAADAIVILQGERLVDCNERALEMFGMASIDQLSSRASFDFFPPLQPNGKDSRVFSAEKLKSAHAGAPQFFEWRHVKFDGTVFDAEVSLSTFKLGEETFIQAIIRDITQRTQLEEALRHSEQRYRSLFEHAGDGIMIMQGEEVIDCNKRALEIYGISREQLISLTNYSLSPTMQPNGQTSAEFYQDRLEALRSGIPQSFEWLGCKLDGTPVETEVTLTTFMLDGKPLMQSLIRDITRRKQLEAALHDSELRYRTLFENAGDSIVIMKGMQIVDCNARTLELYGYAREEIWRNSATVHFPLTQPNGRASDEFFSEMLDASRSGVPQVFEWTGQKSDGTKVCTEVTLTTFILNNTMYSQSIGRDITQRKQLQRSLEDNELRYRTLFEHSGEAISIIKDFQIIDCNEPLGAIYGYSRDEILSNPTAGFIPPRQPNGQDSLEFLAEKVAASRAGTPQNYEWHGRKRDGTDIVVEISLASFKLGDETFEQATTRDITHRKYLEEALRDSELRYRTLFESAGDAIAIMEGEQIIDCNRRTMEIYGVARDDLLSLPSGKLFPHSQPGGKSAQELYDEMVTASRAGFPQVYEWYGSKPDGSSVVTEISMTTFVVGGRHFEQAISRDITERKQMQRALQDSNKVLEERVAIRTHELEQACAELLQRNAQFRMLASRLTRAEEGERRRIARLLHDNHQQLLVAAKFKAEMLVSHLYGPDINAAGAQLVDILEQAIDVTRSLTMELAPPILYGSGLVEAMHWLAGWMEENHQLKVLVNGSLPVTPIPAEVSSVLFRAVRELLFNVSKHAGVKQARVNVVAFDEGLRITVIDHGNGFDVAQILQKPRSYGLFSIREQLASLDGALDMFSTPHSGSVCTVSVPLVPIADVVDMDIRAGVDRITTEVADTQQVFTRPVRILVADDHALARDALVQMLDMVEDFDVVGEAFDGLDALEKTRLLQPELVLMDATMPRLDGLDATRCITAEFPQIKVIGLSMHPGQDMEPQFREAGAAYYLQKLTPTEELFAAIRGVMGRDLAESFE